MAAARGGLALAALLGLALGRVAASCPSTKISGNKYISVDIPGDLPGGKMPPGDVNLVVVDWEACFMEPGPETCPTVKVAPGDYVFFKWTQVGCPPPAPPPPPQTPLTVRAKPLPLPPLFMWLTFSGPFPAHAPPHSTTTWPSLRQMRRTSRAPAASRTSPGP